MASFSLLKGIFMSLTKKQKQVYDYIVDYLEDNGYSPTQVEIQQHFGFKSLGSVQDYIRYLRNAGYLQSDTNSVRGLTPINPNQQNIIEAIEIPLHGKVAAGNPIEAMEGVEKIEIPASMIGTGSHYALTVNGESMIEDGILDGDTIIVKEQKNASNGDTVIAVIDNEATVKRYYKKQNKIELHPANSSMKPIIVDQGDFQIKGILVGLYRSY
jgi:SOS regulatory protein LexA